MKIILDTNVLLISFPKKSPYRPIYDAIQFGKIELGISTEILFEYEEILSQKTTPNIAINVIKSFLNLENVIRQEVFFNWNLIHSDPDDNKMVDCAVAFGADYLVTEDKHFNAMKNIDFPKLEIIGADDFLDLISKT